MNYKRIYILRGEHFQWPCSVMQHMTIFTLTHSDRGGVILASKSQKSRNQAINDIKIGHSLPGHARARPY